MVNRYLPYDVGGLQLADGEDVLGNGSIVVPLAAVREERIERAS